MKDIEGERVKRGREGEGGTDRQTGSGERECESERQHH